MHAIRLRCLAACRTANNRSYGCGDFGTGSDKTGGSKSDRSGGDDKPPPHMCPESNPSAPTVYDLTTILALFVDEGILSDSTTLFQCGLGDLCDNIVSLHHNQHQMCRKYGHNLPCDSVMPYFETLPYFPTGIFRCTAGEVLGLGANKCGCYKNPEYFSFHHMTFYDMHMLLRCYRQPSPKTGRKK